MQKKEKENSKLEFLQARLWDAVSDAERTGSGHFGPGTFSGGGLDSLWRLGHG